MINFLLSLFKPFRRFIETMGADYNQFISILRLKLIMDDRKTKGFVKASDQSQTNMLFKQSTSQIIMGLVFLFIVGIIKSPITYFYFAHMMIMVLMAMTIVSEFSTILFDTTENNIIQPLPVKGNTVGLARNAHILIFLTMSAFCLSVPSIVLSIFKFGFAASLLYIATLVLNVLFTLSFANVLYLSLMKTASGERLKNIIMYFQIAIIILFMAGYQFGMQIVDRKEIANMVLSIDWYTYLIPPAFIAGFIDAFTNLQFDLPHLIMIAETIVVPVLAIYATGKYLTPIFNQKLMELEASDKSSKQKTEKTKSSIWFRLMQFAFTNSAPEKAAFKLMWKMSGRERILIQTILPSVGYVIFMIIMPFLKKGINLDQIRQGNMHIWLLYSFLFITLTISSALHIGNYPNESSIFRSLPLASPAQLFKGFIKAAFARFFVPFYFVVSILALFLSGLRVLPDIIIVFLVIYLFTLLIFLFQKPFFPFSQKKSVQQGGIMFLKMIKVLLIGGSLGAIHWLLNRYGFQHANLLMIAFCLGFLYYINRFAYPKKINWAMVEKTNQ